MKELKKVEILNIPDTLKIGWKDYRVLVKPPDKDLFIEGKECYGSINKDDQEIIINYYTTEEQQQATLLHEIIQGISDYLYLDFTEDTVVRFTEGLFTVLKDNPDLLNTK